MPATGSFDKGAAIEEWADLHFFRPAGLRIARACLPTGISPDQVTFVALIIGLVAGRLCFYQNAALNALGVVLFVVSDIFDSADGQLARMRGTSTRLGKILDGIADSVRFVNLYVQLIARLLVAGAVWWLVVPLGIAAGLAHARQSAGADYIRQLYLHLAERGAGEFSLPEDMDAIEARPFFQAMQVRIYRHYLARHGRMVPRSLELVRRIGADDVGDDVARAWTRLQRPLVRQCAWIGQNIRFLLLAITVVPGYPMAFLWITLVPMSAILLLLLRLHERNAATVLGPVRPQLAEAA